MKLTPFQQELLQLKLLCVCGCRYQIHGFGPNPGDTACCRLTCGCKGYVDAKSAEDVVVIERQPEDAE